MKRWKVAAAGTAFYAVLIMYSVASAGISRAKEPIGKLPKPQPVANQVLVSFKKSASISDIAALHGKAQGNVIKKIRRIGIEVVEVPDGEVADAIKAYKNNPNVIFAEPNYRRTLTTTEGSLPAPYNVANSFTEQWHLANTGQEFGAVCTFDFDTFEDICEAPKYAGAPDADIDAPEGWALTHGSSDIKIAVLDSGVDCTHPDLDDKCIEQVNFTESLTSTDLVGHGTHVASIAAAETDNGIGTAGVAWNASIGSLKVCHEVTDELRGFVGAYCNDADVIDAIEYAVDNGYQVINMSFSGSDESAAVEAAVNYAWENGIVIVAAAGNSYDMMKQYPAAYEHVIGVAATDHYDNLAEFSTFSNDSDDWVSVAAPGDIILAAIPGVYCDGAPDCYDWKSGTSMAAPVVSGIAAMVWSYIADPTNTTVRECIEKTAENTGALGQDFLAWTKYGRVNLHDALLCIPKDPELCADTADTDGDGVPDANDECPDTPANTPTNSNGCPAKVKVVVIPMF